MLTPTPTDICFSVYSRALASGLLARCRRALACDKIAVEQRRSEAPAYPAKSLPAPLMTHQANPIGRFYDSPIWEAAATTAISPAGRTAMHRFVEVVFTVMERRKNDGDREQHPSEGTA